jgi:hypothetical protein
MTMRDLAQVIEQMAPLIPAEETQLAGELEAIARNYKAPELHGNLWRRAAEAFDRRFPHGSSLPEWAHAVGRIWAGSNPE